MPAIGASTTGGQTLIPPKSAGPTAVTCLRSRLGSCISFVGPGSMAPENRWTIAQLTVGCEDDLRYEPPAASFNCSKVKT